MNIREITNKYKEQFAEVKAEVIDSWQNFLKMNPDNEYTLRALCIADNIVFDDNSLSIRYKKVFCGNAIWDKATMRVMLEQIITIFAYNDLQVVE